jgi:DNA invertase Pin-like site-specific DNA recombinase
MTVSAHHKVTASHLRRDAYLYVRQSTVRQVFEYTESTRRQYALRERAVAMGWPIERVIVIDCDLGQSGASSVDREGFQNLVAEVGMGRAGIVLGLEVSRLARNSTDWHRLLEICALTDTLILDEDGVYNPSDFNDRLVLGLKGTMSEAELHMLRARLRGGVLNAARRGALQTPLPVGLVYDSGGKAVRDPDGQVQRSFEHLFETFERTGSASATVKHFREQGLRFPRRPRSGPTRASWSGNRCVTGAFCASFTTRDTPVPSASVALTRASVSTAASRSWRLRARSGLRCCPMRIPATSPGSSSKAT